MRVHSKVALRGLRHRERMQTLAEAAPVGVRVVPSKDEYRAVLKHPKGSGFPATGSKEWPNDRFTKRRLADGSVTNETEEMRAEHHNKASQRHKPPPHQDKDDQSNNSAA